MTDASLIKMLNRAVLTCMHPIGAKGEDACHECANCRIRQELDRRHAKREKERKRGRTSKN